MGGHEGVSGGAGGWHPPVNTPPEDAVLYLLRSSRWRTKSLSPLSAPTPLATPLVAEPTRAAVEVTAPLTKP